MATFDSKQIIDEIIANDGYYFNDPRVLAIHSYDNSWGGQSYHVAWNEGEIANLYSSPFCSNIKLLWARK